jgi:glucose/arabinose dehydrogenase
MVIALLVALQPALQAPLEADFYPVVGVEPPTDVVLEVGGIALLADGRPLICTRRGEVWLLDNAYSADGKNVGFKKWFEGLQEPLGLLRDGEWIYTVQRGELSKLRDADGDGKADELVTIADPWQISGNYHEYAFGPTWGPDKHLWVTLNRPFGEEPFGHANWRGFAMSIDPTSGAWQPMCSGLRSPCGVATAPTGEVFYTDNQGEWVGTNKLSLLEPGDFYGHPWGIASTKLPEWKFGEVAPPPNKVLWPEAVKSVPHLTAPAVWFPYDVMGRSAAGFVWDTEGRFGPFFQNHVFVGDQYDASVMRVTLEKVNGRWQGACYPFRMGLESGVTRVAWGADRSMFVGMTNRGWGSRGQGTYGLQRVTWSGKTPFEVREMRAAPGGFELEFTAPVDAKLATDPASYTMSSYTYELHEEYGSPKMDVKPLAPVPSVVDATHVRLALDGLRSGYVHELHYSALRDAHGAAPLHDRAYYTLVELPAQAAASGSTGSVR